LDRREESLTAGKEAVYHYRALAVAHPEAFSPDLARSLENLRILLSDLGRREEALTTAEETVQVRRTLAAAHPDRYGAEFARSLWVLGRLYAEIGRPGPAIATTAEAIELVTPVLAAVPLAAAGMMTELVQNYFAQCAAAGREPDEELLGPVIAAFERLNATEEKK
jgi:hypothetical protein